MEKILVTYSTFSGTTADVARTIAEEIKKNNEAWQITLKPLSEIDSLSGYDACVIGGPMIVGWHREVKNFLVKNRANLAGKPVALFATAMNLTQTGETSLNGVPIFIDAELAAYPKNPGKLSFKERYASIPNYVRPMLQAAGKVKPVSAALFGGRLDMYRLKWWAVIFVMLIIGAKPGEKRNWEAIRTWAKEVAVQFGSN